MKRKDVLSYLQDQYGFSAKILSLVDSNKAIEQSIKRGKVSCEDITVQAALAAYKETCIVNFSGILCGFHTELWLVLGDLDGYVGDMYPDYPPFKDLDNVVTFLLTDDFDVMDTCFDFENKLAQPCCLA